MMARTVLWIYPVLEVACLVAAWRSSGWAMVAWLAGAALSLCLALHVTYHEWMHQGHPGGVPGEFVLSALLGMPFDGYRWHHLNHHKHENSLEDFSTTWRAGAHGPEPQGWLGYSLGWPRQLVRSGADLRARGAAGTLPPGLGEKVLRQKRFLQLMFLAMLVVSWRGALAWMATMYAGWALISVHNYGQHPPVAYGTGIATSYRGAVYNRVFCANGLHHEHHRDPALSWDRLVPLDGAPVVTRPHLLLPEVRA